MLATVGLGHRDGGWEHSFPALFMASHGELAGKFPGEKQWFMLILKKAQNVLSLGILVFLCASKKKVEIMALSIF